MERAIQVQLLAFLDKNKILSVFQSGFSKKHSTETAVVYLVDHILEHMDRQQLAGAAFVDLKKGHWSCWSPLPPSQAKALWS